MSGATKVSATWPKLLPFLGIALAVVLVAAAGVVWRAGSGTPAGDGGLGEVVALTQATRGPARAVISGGPEQFDQVAARHTEISGLRSAIANSVSAPDAARRFAGDTGLWQPIEQSLEGLAGTREKLLTLGKARADLLELAPRLLVITGNLASSLPPADLETNRPFLARFEVTVEGLQQSLRSLVAGGNVDEAARRVDDAGQYLEQMIRGLRGEDSTLGVVPVRAPAAKANLDAASKIGRAHV